ncbi:MAG: aminopeptidase P family N-terminal domain-containing protein, partial [Lachnospiraceae bacterium]|nr:aminopeptidase P family N-terminal domain-containing protein [Lachnospiraceae bacterium]
MGREHAERIERLRSRMAELGADYYLVPTSDCHNSEYVGDYFKVREYLSGFTGSNGTLLVTADKALLWTDGRYFIQAARELDGSGIELMKMGEEQVPTLPDYLKEQVKKGQKIAFDGHVVTCRFGRKLEALAEEKQASLLYETDPADGLWEDRPALPKGKILLLPEELTGQSAKEKIELVRSKMQKCGAKLHLLTKLDDVMWLFNIRGTDIPCNPVALSYAILTQERAFLFLQREAVTEQVKAYLDGCHVTVEVYDEFYQTAARILEEETEHSGQERVGVLLDEQEISYALYRIVQDKARIVWEENPTLLLKAVKNETELAHMRQVYIKDSVAVIRMIRHIKEAVSKQAQDAQEHGKNCQGKEAAGKQAQDGQEQGNKPLTERYAAGYIDQLRRQIEGFLDLSFETISAYGANAAMMHYTADEASDTQLKPEGFLLVDSGGQYLGGTTDVTRTIALGALTDEQRRDFTLTAVGMLRLLNVQFLYGCTGRNLDIIAREPLWRIGRDYKCGTGHGVG